MLLEEKSHLLYYLSLILYRKHDLLEFLIAGCYCSRKEALHECHTAMHRKT